MKRSATPAAPPWFRLRRRLSGTSGRTRIRTSAEPAAPLSLSVRWALTPPFHPCLRRTGGGILSVALAFPRLIVRGILLFKRTPCSSQSGLSSTGFSTGRDRLQTDAPIPDNITMQERLYKSIFSIFSRFSPACSRKNSPEA